MIMKTIVKVMLFLIFVVSGAWLVMVWKQADAGVAEQVRAKAPEKSPKKVRGATEAPRHTKSNAVPQHDTTERQRAILDVMRRSGPVDNRLLVKELGGIHERTLRRDLVRLQSLGLVRKTGSTKSATYSAVA